MNSKDLIPKIKELQNKVLLNEIKDNTLIIFDDMMGDS